MELRTESQRRSTVSRGVAGVNKDRKYVGHYWMAARSGALAHANSFCQMRRRGSDYRRLPVFETEGTLFYYEQGEVQDKAERVSLCEHCPPIDGTSMDWYTEGKCYGTEDLRFGNGDVSVIAEMCDHCPVVVECFEYGVLAYNENAGTIWGGFLIPRQVQGRLKKMEARRKELGAAPLLIPPLAKRGTS